MDRETVDDTAAVRITSLGQRVLAGGRLEAEEARWLFAREAAEDIHLLMAWASRIRARFRGNRIHLCSIVNAKAGGCPEDCKFCAQSAFYDTSAPRYGFIDPGPMRQAAAEAAQAGVTGFGLVAAWRGLEEGPLLDEVCARIRELADDGGVRPDASLGLIRRQAVADRLKAAGLACYNHNLETSRRFFPHQCTTHTYDDRLATLRHLRQAGIRLCSGGILGLGETRDDRCDLALALREEQVDIVPINILNPIPGTPYEANPPLSVLEILKTIACFRFILPRQEIMVAGGRVVNLRDAQPLIFLAGASALMVGNYLTTLNQPVERDLAMLRDLGLQPAGATHNFAEPPAAVAPTPLAGAAAEPAPVRA